MNKTGYEHLPANFSVNMYFHFRIYLGIELLSHGVKCLFTLTENCFSKWLYSSGPHQQRRRVPFPQ